MTISEAAPAETTDQTTIAESADPAAETSSVESAAVEAEVSDVESAADEAEAKELLEETPPGDSTRFDFQHKVFTIPETVFRVDRSSGRVAMHMSMGGSVVSVDVNQVTAAFNIAAGSHDEKLLKKIKHALKHVREIRPGNSIPKEILDGTASWTLEPRHLDLARSRLLVQLASWVSDGGQAIESTADVMAMIESPEVIEKVNTAFGKAAEELGLSGLEGKQQITNMIEQMARELAYIEALRDKIRSFYMIRSKLRKLRHIYVRNRNMGDSVERIIRLISPPLEKVVALFTAMDAQTSEIISSLKRLSETVQAVRETRDKLREFILVWDDLDCDWVNVPIEINTATEQLIKSTYRFAATHFLSSQRWV